MSAREVIRMLHHISVYLSMILVGLTGLQYLRLKGSLRKHKGLQNLVRSHHNLLHAHVCAALSASSFQATRCALDIVTKDYGIFYHVIPHPKSIHGSDCRNGLIFLRKTNESKSPTQSCIFVDHRMH